MVGGKRDEPVLYRRLGPYQVFLRSYDILKSSLGTSLTVFVPEPFSFTISRCRCEGRARL